METNHIELKAIDNSVFESFESFMHESIVHFNSLDRLDEDITIYMPEYFNDMLSQYISSRGHQKPMKHMDTFRAVKVIVGYENKVIVAIKDGALYSIKPQEKPIP